MSDFTRSFMPWEDFRNGFYLAGAECIDEAQAPDGWVKWVIPGYEYLRLENDGKNTFSEMLRYMEDNSVNLVGAVHDFTCLQTGKNYMFFPIKKI